MRTLIFNGSARKNGDTQSLIEELTRQLEGEVRIINAHDCNVRACIDCRRCWEKPECSIQDGWQQIDGKWYQLDENGQVAADKTGWQQINGKWYFSSTYNKIKLKDLKKALTMRTYDESNEPANN